MQDATLSATQDQAGQRARFVREHLPPEGLFAGMDWRISPSPFPLQPQIVRELESLGRVLLQFYRAVNLLYRRSVEGKQPEWVSRWLDLGKPADLLSLQRSPAFKNDVPRVIRPDLLLTDHGLAVTELDSVPGGIGLTGWLNQIYAGLGSPVLGGNEGMTRGFASIFGDAPKVRILISEEASDYRPEMQWLVRQLPPHFSVENADVDFLNSSASVGAEGDGTPAQGKPEAVYRFFELFDLPNVPAASRIFQLAEQGKIRVTPPPKPIFEEKLLFALLWNRNLQTYWRQELGQAFFDRLRRLAPCTWVVDPAPLPPHAAIPELNLTDWRQLEALSQKERDFILKVSGFSPRAWGARGVYLGSDLPQAQWASAVEEALESFERSPFVLQRYEKPALVEAEWFDFERQQVVPMKGRVRLCPYYFVSGEAEAARATLGGVLATICPADKKIIHGMSEAILAPCVAAL